MSLIEELKRRNVIRMAGLYLVAAWLTVQVSSTVLPMFDAPPWVPRAIVILLVIGFVPAMVFAWVFELTPQGVKRESEIDRTQSMTPRTGRRMDRMILVGLALIIVLMGIERVWFAARTSSPAALPAATAQSAGTGAPAAATASVAASTNAIAVMAFEDLSPAHDQGYFSDGMAEEILNALTRIRELRVLGRSSSFQYKGKDIDPRRIGAELGVAHILDGSVRRQGDLVRIAATLISTVDGAAQWTKEYNGRLADLFDLQDNCAHDIASELKIVLTGGQRPLVDKVTANPEAYALYVEAQTLVRERFGDSLPRAIEKLDAAVKLDPSFARAWSKRAVAFAVLGQYVASDWRQNWSASEESARRALALDPNDAEAHAARSYNLFSQRRYVDMAEPMRRALEVDPGNETARYWEVNELSAMGHTRDAVPRLDALMANDPENGRVIFYKAFMSWREHDRDTLLALGRRLQALGSPWGDVAMSTYYASAGDCESGVKPFSTRQRIFGSGITVSDSETIYRGICSGGAAREPAKAILLAHQDDQWVPTLWLEMGEPERAFDLFENGSVGLSDAYLNWLWQPEDWSRKARQYPAFQGFAKRMGLVDYWKKYGWPDVCKPLPETGPDAFACE
jgi:TolB-like protein/tetratricopeptide (TPR) repeat protein